VPYEKERLRIKLSELQFEKDKHANLHKYELRQPHDPLIKMVNLKYARLSKILKGIEDLENEAQMKDEFAEI